MPGIPAFLDGALLTASLIVVIGPQNLHVLRTGLSHRYVASTVALCIGADALLFGVALSGVGAALAAQPTLQGKLCGTAVPLLLWLAWRAARDAAAPGRSAAATHSTGPTRGDALTQTALVTFGNPLVWIETLLVFGTTAATRPSGEQLAFGAGALLASAMWFACLGFGAQWAWRWLARAWVLRGLSALSAVLLVSIAWQLAGARPLATLSLVATLATPRP